MIKKVDHPSRKAGRPIRLDKGAIKRFAKYLSGRILRDLIGDFASDTPISDTGRYLIKDMITIQDVLGNDIETLVLVKSERAPKRLGMITGGGAGTTSRGKQAIQINLNGSWTPDEFSEPSSSFGRQNLPKELFSILLHELTHIADIFKKKRETTRRVLREDEVDLEDYYNRPEEVKAYMQDVADEVLSRLPKLKEMHESAERNVSFNKMIKQSLVLSDSWERIEPYLSRQNKKKIMSAVYREAEDWRDDTDYS